MINPIILCGGSGTRLWPLSRKSYPKQFVPLVSDESLFQSSAKRLSGDAFKAPLILTNSDFRFIVTEQLSEVGINPGAILIEPEGRNTAPAILAAALWLHQTEPEGLMLVAPSDHVVPDISAFHKAVSIAAEAARSGKIVTFGVIPSHPETGFGYLELAENPGPESDKALALKRFVEKPDLAAAEKMIEDNRFLWNAGIFLFSVRSILDAFKAYAPQILAPVQIAVKNARHDLGFLRLAPDAWQDVEDISIDYAIMERASNLAVVPLGSEWSDLGDWSAVWKKSIPNAEGVVCSENVTAISCERSLLRSEDDRVELVGIGLKDTIVVAMPDAVLVADASETQRVKEAVQALKDKGVAQSGSFPKDHRPWGWFESLAIGDRFQVKRIVVHPGAALSLQSHHHRAEHWIVVQGTARVTIDDSIKLVSENQSVYIPLGSAHRLENPGKMPMVLIEVQTGSYLGEDDIIRYEDIYARDQKEPTER